MKRLVEVYRVVAHTFFICFLLEISLGSNAQEKAMSADSILAKAYRQAAAQNKNVFLIFHASWCGWCHKMDASINDPVCKKSFNDNYVIVQLVVSESKDRKNLENAGGTELMVKYSDGQDGIPFWVVFDKKGEWLADSKIRKEGEGRQIKGANTGCPAAAEEVSYFVSVLKRTSEMTDEQLKIIEKRFRENEN